MGTWTVDSGQRTEKTRPLLRPLSTVHCPLRCGLAAGGVDRGGDLVEGAFGVAAQGADGGDADHDDERQHDRVLDGRRAVFVPQEIDRELTELVHVPFPFVDEEPTNVWRPRRFLTAG